MAGKNSESAALERQAAIKRVQLTATLNDLRSHLTLAHLAEEATQEVSQMSVAAAQVVMEKAKSPVGLSAAGVGVAMAAYLLSQAASRNRLPATNVKSLAPRPLDSPFPSRPSAPIGGVRPLIGLAAAIGLGIGINKLIPVSEKEKQMLAGIGNEVQEAVERWAKEQARRLVQPPEGGSMGAINLLAMLVGVLGNAKNTTSV